MKSIFLLLTLVLSLLLGHVTAQSVGINDDGSAPSAFTKLEIKSALPTGLTLFNNEYINGLGQITQIGIRNNLNTTNQRQFGIINSLDGDGNEDKTCALNEIITSGNGSCTGVLNNLQNSGNGTMFGSLNQVNSSGTGHKYGVFSIVSAGGSGTHYGGYFQSYSTGPNYGGYFHAQNGSSNHAGYFLANGTGINHAAYFNANGGTENYAAVFDEGKVVVNESASDSDFRVESSNHEAQLFVDASADAVGINTSTPSDALHVKADVGQDAFRVQVGGGTKFKIYSNGAIVFGNTGGVAADVVYVKNKLGLGIGNPDYRLELPNNPANGIGKALATEWMTYSDKRVKRNVKNSKYGLEEILQLRPVLYDHHSSNFEHGTLEINDLHQKDLGFIAQEVYAIISEVVDRPEDESKELWTMNYEKLTPVLVKAVQELADENTKLRASLARQTEQHQLDNEKMNARLEMIEAKFNTQ